MKAINVDINSGFDINSNSLKPFMTNNSFDITEQLNRSMIASKELLQ